jgi:tRNA A58 N-methylase Trm61
LNNFRKLTRALFRHGLIGTAHLAYQKLGRKSETRSAFDIEHDVDTDGDDDLLDLAIEAPLKHIFHGTRYQATSPEMFAQIMLATPIKPGMAFIDIGSGKGRAMLMAAAFPFQRIIGVEFATDLCAIAQANIVKFGSAVPMEVICADALAWELPDEASLVYLYNPFGEPLMRKFVDQVERSLKEHPRDLLVVYRNPTCREVWRHWKVVHETPQFVVMEA